MWLTSAVTSLAKKFSPDAQADYQRAGLLDAEELARLLRAEHAEDEAALQPAGRAHDGALEVAVVVLLEQMGHDLGVGLAAEDVALALELAAQGGEVLYYAVVHDGEAGRVSREVRVRVGVGGRAVRRPAGVRYAAGAAQRRAAVRAFGQVLATEPLALTISMRSPSSTATPALS